MEVAAMLEDTAVVDVGNLEAASGEDFQSLQGKMKLPISRTPASFLDWVALRRLHNFPALRGLIFSTLQILTHRLVSVKHSREMVGEFNGL